MGVHDYQLLKVEELRQALDAFVAAYGPTTKPCVWHERDVTGAQFRNTIVTVRNYAPARLGFMTQR